MAGPLAGIRIVEMGGIGPGPMAAMMLADMGAKVIRIERREPSGLGVPRPEKYDLLFRGRPAIALDLKEAHAVDLVLRLVEKADGLIDVFRPGVMERLGLGPDVCLARNPRLVFGRMTGWGQEGPLAAAAGHDLNYIALTGALAAIGRQGQLPAPPLNLVGDFGGGSAYLAFGMVCAMLEARQSGLGQVVDAAIVDGAAHLMTAIYGLSAAGIWQSERGTNVLDSGAFFYDVFACKCGGLVSVAPIEPKFLDQLYEKLEIDRASMPEQMDRSQWPAAKAVLAAKFAERTRAEWCSLLEGSDVCFAPVLDMAEVPEHPHMRARGTFIEIDDVIQPAPAPRFSRSPPVSPTPPRMARNTSPETALADWFDQSEIAALLDSGVLRADGANNADA